VTLVNRFDQIEYYRLSDVGVRRSHNQDNSAVLPAKDEEEWRQRGHLFLVADGMGAHAVGEKASEQAAGVIPHLYNKHAQQGPASALRKAFVEANASIHACGQQNREFEGMGTTTTALLLRPDGAWIGHVGDSRAYRIRDGWIEQLSYDHSLVWEYARLKHVDPAEVQDIPSNVIHRCLGPEPFVQVDVEGPHPVRAGDIFLLCSDGLSGPVSDREMGAVASVLPPKEACQLLVDLANLRGGPDNITVLIVKVANGPSSNGQGEISAKGKETHWPRPPWWLTSLLSGTLCAAGAAGLQYYDLPGGLLVFLLAVGAILAGLVGLVLYYQREKELRAVEEDLPQPRIHRKLQCLIERPMVDRLEKALEALRQRVNERHWETDWNAYQDHRARGDEALVRGDLPTAFREFCRAMLPLTESLSRQRNKEEVFQPLWDKTQ
jgi:protein phosphatase